MLIAQIPQNTSKLSNPGIRLFVNSTLKSELWDIRRAQAIGKMTIPRKTTTPSANKDKACPMQANPPEQGILRIRNAETMASNEMISVNTRMKFAKGLESAKAMPIRTAVITSNTPKNG